MELVFLEAGQLRSYNTRIEPGWFESFEFPRLRGDKLSYWLLIRPSGEVVSTKILEYEL